MYLNIDISFRNAKFYLKESYLAVALIDGALEYLDNLAADVARDALDEDVGGRDDLGDLTESIIALLKMILARPLLECK